MCAMPEKAMVTQRLEKKAFRLETTELLGNCTKGNCALEKWMREWVMLSFANTNNWSALEQVIYPSNGALEIFDKEDYVFFWEDQRNLHVCFDRKKQIEGNIQ